VSFRLTRAILHPENGNGRGPAPRRPTRAPCQQSGRLTLLRKKAGTLDGPLQDVPHLVLLEREVT
jgi:hypothetical protein